MNAFKLRRFHALVILQCVRWYCKYAISYRQLEEMQCCAPNSFCKLEIPRRSPDDVGVRAVSVW
jgi:hypothetical protein